MARAFRFQLLKSLAAASPLTPLRPYRSIHTLGAVRCASLLPWSSSLSSVAHPPRSRNDLFARLPYAGSLCFGRSDAVLRSYSSEASPGGEDDKWNISEWIDSSKEAAKSLADVIGKAREQFYEFASHSQQLINSSPFLSDVAVPVGGTGIATAVAWFIMPRILRRLHNYSFRGRASLLSMKVEEIPYEKSFWGALEDPVRYLVTFAAFTQLAVKIAPTTFASEHVFQVWRGAFAVSIVWFLYRWKSNVFDRIIASEGITVPDRDRLRVFDRLSSAALLVLGLMGTAEACGVAVQSILTIGGIGGVATAFAARDILGNVLTGLSMQFWNPFSIGDSIKAGSIEGRVMEIGLTTTSLLNPEKFLVLVPNSLFSSQVIVNKSRAHLSAIMTKVPVRANDIEKVPNISEDIKSMLKSLSKVDLEADLPYCFLSQIEDSYAELTIGCTVKDVRKHELYSIKQDILLQSVQIIKRHGADLGSTREGCNYP
ncbi:Mechanosensitive ion channel protein 1 [Nymphaea thermarum]|nr:Mechanosensitive ion channel protein 1 [Nymphaea thermarum]